MNDFITAGFTSDQFNGINLLAQQEIGHAAIINSTIRSLGGVPTSRCFYNFGSIPNVTAFVSMGQKLENGKKNNKTIN